MRRETTIIGMITIIFMIVVFFISSATNSSDQAKIQKWASDNKYVIVTSERCFFYSGPYWTTKNTRIYKVDLENNKTHWFRFGLWGTDTDIEEY